MIHADGDHRTEPRRLVRLGRHSLVGRNNTISVPLTNPHNGILMQHGFEEPGDVQDIRLKLSGPTGAAAKLGLPNQKTRNQALSIQNLVILSFLPSAPRIPRSKIGQLQCAATEEDGPFLQTLVHQENLL